MATKMLSIPDAAEVLGVTPRWVRRAIFERRVPYVKLGHLVRIDADDIDALIAASRVEPRELAAPRGRVRERREPFRRRFAASGRTAQMAGGATRARQPRAAGEVTGRDRPARLQPEADVSSARTPGKRR